MPDSGEVLRVIPPLDRDRVFIELGLQPPYGGYEWCQWHRNADGTVAHRRDCTRKGESSKAWFWAQDHFRSDFGLGCGLKLIPWVRPCRYCLGDIDEEF